MRKVAFYVLNGFAVLAGLFISGYIFEDPGGWQAVGFTAAWVLPTLLAGVVAWRFGSSLRNPVIVLATISMIISGSQAVWSTWWRDVLNSLGPVEAMGMFAVVFGLNAYARYHDELLGGALMFGVALTPILAVFFGAGMHAGVLGGSTSALMMPGVVIGLAYVLDAESHKHAHHGQLSAGLR